MRFDLEHLPPLKAIEAFVVVAQVGNFSRAADYLSISPSALSRRIKKLEEHLGDVLFVRGRTRVRLTDVGEVYLEEAEKALKILAFADKKKDVVISKTVSVTAPNMFIQKFVGHHLRDFERKNPDIILTFDTNPQIYDLRQSTLDLAVRFGVHWPGFAKETMFLCSGGPACAPTLAYGEDVPRRIEALQKHTLLHFRQEPEGWARFFAAAGCRGLKGAVDRYFDNPELLYATACQGLGIALIDPVLHRELLDPGLLIRPIKADIATGDGFHLVFAPGADAKPAVRRFCDWIHDLPEIRELRNRQESFEPAARTTADMVRPSQAVD